MYMYHSIQCAHVYNFNSGHLTNQDTFFSPKHVKIFHCINNIHCISLTGKGQCPGCCKTHQQGLSPQSWKCREIRQALPPRERWWGARPRPGAHPPPADLQTSWQYRHQTGRLRHTISRWLQVIHHNQATQPTLHAWGVHQSISSQLHLVSRVCCIYRVEPF